MNIDVIRAWKDAEYRESLSSSELAALPENPAGPMELLDDELDSVAGGDSHTFPPLMCNTCRCTTDSTCAISCC